MQATDKNRNHFTLHKNLFLEGPKGREAFPVELQVLSWDVEHKNVPSSKDVLDLLNVHLLKFLKKKNT
jgi:hypothetical protein